MASKHIVVVWPSGHVVCEGDSALDPAPEAERPAEPDTEPCPPTKRSPGAESGIFPVGAPRPSRVA